MQALSRSIVAVVFSALLVGCASAPSAPADNLLDDTAWRLVDFVSMDDAIGRITAQASYTMHLHADGSMSMQLNCNRGRGSWKSTPSLDQTGEPVSSGGFEFGPVAVTKAFCPPPNMDAQLSRDLEYVRSFVIRDGNLFLSLFADGGIYQFEPLPVPPE